jgi:hypothetical protein
MFRDSQWHVIFCIYCKGSCLQHGLMEIVCLDLHLRHFNGTSTLWYPWGGVHILVDLRITNPTFRSLPFCPKHNLYPCFPNLKGRPNQRGKLSRFTLNRSPISPPLAIEILCYIAQTSEFYFIFHLYANDALDMIDHNKGHPINPNNFL